MLTVYLGLLLSGGLPFGKAKQPPKPTPVEEYVTTTRAAYGVASASAGSLYIPGARLGDLARDLRASQVGDLVTIVVNDRASAVTRGATNASRKSSASASVPAIAGPRINIPALNPALELESGSKLEGAGTTSRTNTLSATVTARVIDVMPNGFMIVEGIKDVQANSERQRITVRGVVRWNDLSASNRISSDRVGQMQIEINGKGVVGDAIRRPNILYRILLGILPF